VAVILLFAAVNSRGVQTGGRVQWAATVAKIGGIAVIVFGAVFFSRTGSWDHLKMPVTERVVPSGAGAFGAAMIAALWAYQGWSNVPMVAGEIEKPERNVPRALIFGMLGVAACYVLANVAYLAVLGHAGLAASKAPAADVMRHVFGETGARAIAVGVAISTLGFCNISLIGAARVFQVMGSDGVFFRVAGKLHPRWRSPNIALLLLAGWAILLALTGTFDQLLNYSTVGDWLGIAAVIGTVFWYHRNSPDATTFRVPLYPLLPIAFLIVVLWIVGVTAWSNPRDAGMGVLITLAGLPVYWFWRWRSR